jgi:hypothetical protein
MYVMKEQNPQLDYKNVELYIKELEQLVFHTYLAGA